MTGAAFRESAQSQTPATQHWSRQEWFYMWTKGLDPMRIAALCRVPYRKVYDHIRGRILENPDLFGQRLMDHDHPALPRGGLPKRRPWTERCEDLAEFRRQWRRFPRSYMQAETSLYSFLQHQRVLFRGGRLDSDRKALLDEQVPGWLTLPKAEREHAQWHRRLVGLQKFREEHGRYPSYKNALDSAEKTLAVWLQRQRHCSREGKLEKTRRDLLDDVVPGWAEVRPRAALRR